MEQRVTDYPQHGTAHPAAGRRALAVLSLRGLVPLLLLLTSVAAPAQQRPSLQLAPLTQQPTLVAPLQITQTKLTLTATPKQVDVGAPVRFDVSWNREVKVALLYKLLVNGKAVAQWTSGDSHSHRFDKAGSYRVQVTAQRLTQDDVRATLVRSNTLSVRVIELPELSVRITPPDMPVRAGEPALFVAKVSPDAAVRYRWQGPNGKTGRSRTFRVDTQGLSAGRHAIELQVVDANKRSANDRTYLLIEAAYQQPIARISPSTLSVTQGEEATFQARYRADDRLKMERRWDGPAGVSLNSDSYAVPTRDLAPGNHAIHFQVRDAQGQVARAEAELRVEASYRKPVVRIQPQTLTLTQGQEGGFQGRYEIDPRLDIAHRLWEGPAGVRQDSDSYTLSTRELETGRHSIHFEVTDTQGRVARATAQLQIEPLAELVVEISPSQRQLLPGERIRFEAVMHDPQPRRYAYRWTGPGAGDALGDSFSVTAGQALVGDHDITLRVRDELGRSAIAHARLQIVAPELTLHGASDTDIQAGDTLLLRGEVSPAAPVEDLRLHIGADDPGRPVELNEPFPISFETPGNYRVHLSGRVADLMLQTRPRLIRVGGASPLPDDRPTPSSLPPWLWWAGGAGLAVLGGGGWWLRRKLRKAVPRATTPNSGISVVVNPNLGQWQGGFHKLPEASPGVRLALVVDPGEQAWHDTPGETPDDRDSNHGQPTTHTG